MKITAPALVLGFCLGTISLLLVHSTDMTMPTGYLLFILMFVASACLRLLPHSCCDHTEQTSQ